MNGATNWYSPSFNPATHLFYFMGLEECNIVTLKPEKPVMGRSYYATGARRVPGEHGQNILLAYNLETRQFQWKYPQIGDENDWAGTMSTAGGLVFFGDPAGSFEAVDGQTGKALWHFNTGQRIHASPMSFAVDGKQFVAVAAGSDLFAFALP